MLLAEVCLHFAVIFIAFNRFFGYMSHSFLEHNFNTHNISLLTEFYFSIPLIIYCMSSFSFTLKLFFWKYFLAFFVLIFLQQMLSLSSMSTLVSTIRWSLLSELFLYYFFYANMCDCVYECHIHLTKALEMLKNT